MSPTLSSLVALAYALFNAANVNGPTSPSVCKPYSPWNYRTAESVFLPKSLSAPYGPQLYPSLISFSCNSFTTFPVEPFLKIVVVEYVGVVLI